MLFGPHRFLFSISIPPTWRKLASLSNYALSLVLPVPCPSLLQPLLLLLLSISFLYPHGRLRDKCAPWEMWRPDTYNTGADGTSHSCLTLLLLHFFARLCLPQGSIWHSLRLLDSLASHTTQCIHLSLTHNSFMVSPTVIFSRTPLPWYFVRPHPSTFLFRTATLQRRSLQRWLRSAGSVRGGRSSLEGTAIS